MQTAPRSHAAAPQPQKAPSEATRIQDVLDGIYEKYRKVDDGAVATYIPELGKADPNDFGICLVTVDGHIFRAGDWNKEFTIQSMCKPLAFQMALEQYGVAETMKYVGVEPSGDAFNSIELDPKTTRPFNPMINAGAIAIASLIKKSPVEAERAGLPRQDERGRREEPSNRLECDAIGDAHRQPQSRDRISDAQLRNYRRASE
jgi:hypothetical protein